jgi:hypothetical protein
MSRLVFDPGGHAVDRILGQFCRQYPDELKNSRVENRPADRFLFILAALVTFVMTTKFLDLGELVGGSIPATTHIVQLISPLGLVTGGSPILPGSSTGFQTTTPDKSIDVQPQTPHSCHVRLLNAVHPTTGLSWKISLFQFEINVPSWKHREQ